MLTGFRPRWKTSGWCAQNPVAISEDTQNEMKKRYKFVTQILAFEGPSPRSLPKVSKRILKFLGNVSCPVRQTHTGFLIRFHLFTQALIRVNAIFNKRFCHAPPANVPASGLQSRASQGGKSNITQPCSLFD